MPFLAYYINDLSTNKIFIKTYLFIFFYLNLIEGHFECHQN